MTTGEPLPDDDDVFRSHPRGFSPKCKGEEPDEAPPGQAGTSQTAPTPE